ncbi:MAG TPA: hypothetical protein VEK07_16870 [Polyangiaceae bacterium]|nr:hypothetical protein [Polyangiaceae bacterium]
MQLSVTRGRARARRFTPLELSIAFALGGSTLAVMVPAFVHQLHASRFVEPIQGLTHLGAAAVAYAREHTVEEAFPASTPLTPDAPPRGRCEVDPPGAWEQPTWKALDFRPVPAGEPHCFAFGFDSALSPGKSTFRAHAHGDLDGDGIVSTFEVTGEAVSGDARGPRLDPGMFIDGEVE